MSAGRFVAAAVPLGIGLWALLWDVEGLNTGWFVFAWTAWLVVLDGLIERLGGASYWQKRRRELGAMLVWSVPFWYVFEQYNLVLLNWYYVAVPRDERLQAVFAAVAFSTVLPACFFHADVIALTRVGRWRCRPWRASGALVGLLWIVGAVFLVAPLVRPQQAFWMLWGAVFVVPDLINRHRGSPSLLRDLEDGHLGRIASLLIGGLLAGGVWESLNFPARTKWLYTVPGFEQLKLFEMPLLGFVGFPLLALEAFAAYTLLCALLRGGRDWTVVDVDQPAVPRRHQRRVLTAIFAISVVMSVVPLERSLFSTRATLADLEGVDGIDVAVIDALAQQGIRTPEQLVRSVEHNAADVPAPLVEVARLVLHKGMGAPAAQLLVDANVRSLDALAAQDPTALSAALRRAAQLRHVSPPPAPLVRLWIRTAAGQGALPWNTGRKTP
jgi:hypothetical protein